MLKKATVLRQGVHLRQGFGGQVGGEVGWQTSSVLDRSVPGFLPLVPVLRAGTQVRQALPVTDSFDSFRVVDMAGLRG